jgi:hypothetical protein
LRPATETLTNPLMLCQVAPVFNRFVPYLPGFSRARRRSPESRRNVCAWLNHGDFQIRGTSAELRADVTSARMINARATFLAPSCFWLERWPCSDQSVREVRATTVLIVPSDSGRFGSARPGAHCEPGIPLVSGYLGAAFSRIRRHCDGGVFCWTIAGRLAVTFSALPKHSPRVVSYGPAR